MHKNTLTQYLADAEEIIAKLSLVFTEDSTNAIFKRVFLNNYFYNLGCSQIFSLRLAF